MINDKIKLIYMIKVCSYPILDITRTGQGGCEDVGRFWRICYSCPEDDLLLNEFSRDDVYDYFSDQKGTEHSDLQSQGTDSHR